MNSYALCDGYISRDTYFHYDGTEEKDDYQDEIYQVAYKICSKHNLNKVLDIGCGSGYKLIKYCNKLQTCGLEIEPTLSWLKENYPDNEWRESDFSQQLDASFDVVICADVIEHLVEPDDLLNFIDALDFQYAVISTPERDAINRFQKGFLWNGPPHNPAHIREWSFLEFAEYISSKFRLLEHQMSQNNAEPVPLCQYVVVEKKNL